MKKKIGILFFLFMTAGILAPGPVRSAQAKNLQLAAESAIVMDVQSGTVLYEKNINKKQYPASITKVMTAMLAIENSTMDETVTYSPQALQLESGASNINIKAGEKISMEDSLYAILLMSANEGCNGVAEHIAGSTENYVNMMNERAKELGCTGTHFANTNGLWLKNHYTTAHDMGLIARAAFKNPDFAKITGTKRYNIGRTNKAKDGHALVNHHGMLVAGNYPQYVYEYCVGGKTGYTLKCRYTLVTYAKKDDMTLVSVILRSEAPWNDLNEYSDTIKLMNYCFENYKRYPIQESSVKELSGSAFFTRFSPYFNDKYSSLTIDEDAGVLLPKDVSLDQTEKKVEFYDAPRTSPDGKNAIGRIVYTYDGKEVGGSEIYYKNAGLPTLNDSIDMSEWFDDAVEKASRDPFPWKKVAVVVILILVAGFAVSYIIQQMRLGREQRERRNRYKKVQKNRRRSRKYDRNRYYKNYKRR